MNPSYTKHLSVGPFGPAEGDVDGENGRYRHRPLPGLLMKIMVSDSKIRTAAGSSMTLLVLLHAHARHGWYTLENLAVLWLVFYGTAEPQKVSK